MVKRLMSWTPDTHEATFILEWDDEDPDAPHVCVEAQVAGVISKDPAADYDAVLLQNQAKNQAVADVISRLPPEMLKPILDSDGDDTGEVVVKDKHKPVWALDKSGRVTIVVPGADAKLTAELDAAVPFAKVALPASI